MDIYTHMKITGTNLFGIVYKFFMIIYIIIMSPRAMLAQDKLIPNIVIVHGAFADGSGWKEVYNILSVEGYHVTIVQNPLTSLHDDVIATKRALDKQNGPVILVGHSWGGVVITEVGVHPKVKALVYVVAYQPDKNETTSKWATAMPNLPECGILQPDKNGIVYYDKSKFHKGFCADVDDDVAEFLYASQAPIFAKCFSTPLQHAAWRSKKTYGIITSQDKSILPEIQKKMYARSKSAVTEIKASHVVYMSQPQAVADVISATANAR